MIKDPMIKKPQTKATRGKARFESHSNFKKRTKAPKKGEKPEVENFDTPKIAKKKNTPEFDELKITERKILATKIEEPEVDISDDEYAITKRGTT